MCFKYIIIYSYILNIYQISNNMPPRRKKGEGEGGGVSAIPDVATIVAPIVTPAVEAAHNIGTVTLGNGFTVDKDNYEKTLTDHKYTDMKHDGLTLKDAANRPFYNHFYEFIPQEPTIQTYAKNTVDLPALNDSEFMKNHIFAEDGITGINGMPELVKYCCGGTINYKSNYDTRNLGSNDAFPPKTIKVKLNGGREIYTYQARVQNLNYSTMGIGGIEEPAENTTIIRTLPPDKLLSNLGIKSGSIFNIDFQNHLWAILKSGAITMHDYVIYLMLNSENINDPAGKFNLLDPTFKKPTGLQNLKLAYCVSSEDTIYPAYNRARTIPGPDFFSRFDMTLSNMQPTYNLCGYIKGFNVQLSITDKSKKFYDTVVSKGDNSNANVQAQLTYLQSKYLDPKAITTVKNDYLLSMASEAAKKGGGDDLQLLSHWFIYGRKYKIKNPFNTRDDEHDETKQFKNKDNPIIFVSHDGPTIVRGLIEGDEILFMYSKLIQDPADNKLKKHEFVIYFTRAEYKPPSFVEQLKQQLTAFQSSKPLPYVSFGKINKFINDINRFFALIRHNYKTLFEEACNVASDVIDLTLFVSTNQITEILKSAARLCIIRSKLVELTRLDISDRLDASIKAFYDTCNSKRNEQLSDSEKNQISEYLTQYKLLQQKNNLIEEINSQFLNDNGTLNTMTIKIIEKHPVILACGLWRAQDRSNRREALAKPTMDNNTVYEIYFEEYEKHLDNREMMSLYRSLDKYTQTKLLSSLIPNLDNLLSFAKIRLYLEGNEIAETENRSNPIQIIPKTIEDINLDTAGILALSQQMPENSSGIIEDDDGIESAAEGGGAKPRDGNGGGGGAVSDTRTKADEKSNSKAGAEPKAGVEPKAGAEAEGGAEPKAGGGGGGGGGRGPASSNKLPDEIALNTFIIERRVSTPLLKTNKTGVPYFATLAKTCKIIFDAVIGKPKREIAPITYIEIIETTVRPQDTLVEIEVEGLNPDIFEIVYADSSTSGGGGGSRIAANYGPVTIVGGSKYNYTYYNLLSRVSAFFSLDHRQRLERELLTKIKHDKHVRKLFPNLQIDDFTVQNNIISKWRQIKFSNPFDGIQLTLFMIKSLFFDAERKMKTAPNFSKYIANMMVFKRYSDELVELVTKFKNNFNKILQKNQQQIEAEFIQYMQSILVIGNALSYTFILLNTIYIDEKHTGEELIRTKAFNTLSPTVFPFTTINANNLLSYVGMFDATQKDYIEYMSSSKKSTSMKFTKSSSMKMHSTKSSSMKMVKSAPMQSTNHQNKRKTQSFQYGGHSGHKLKPFDVSPIIYNNGLKLFNNDHWITTRSTINLHGDYYKEMFTLFDKYDNTTIILFLHQMNFNEIYNINRIKTELNTLNEKNKNDTNFTDDISKYYNIFLQNINSYFNTINQWASMDIFNNPQIFLETKMTQSKNPIKTTLSAKKHNKPGKNRSLKSNVLQISKKHNKQLHKIYDTSRAVTSRTVTSRAVTSRTIKIRKDTNKIHNLPSNRIVA